MSKRYVYTVCSSEPLTAILGAGEMPVIIHSRSLPNLEKVGEMEWADNVGIHSLAQVEIEVSIELVEIMDSAKALGKGG